jgi:anti-sigma regulatory factor (Ser/Thr protein kinase)
LSTEKHALPLPRSTASPAMARRWMEQVLSSLVDADTLADLQLVVTELVDNAYVHGRGRIELQLERRATSVRVAVIDEGEGAVVRIREDGTQLGGYGLKLVDAVAVAWGVSAGTTHVWAELRIRGARPA